MKDEEKKLELKNPTIYQTNENCQVFNGPISGCIFAMPGANVTQQAVPIPNATTQKFSEEMPGDDQLARAIEQCQEFFWGNSSYAVLFCLLRDEYGMADNMSMFETKIEQLPYSRKRTWFCPKGTIANAFCNNPIYKQPLSKWKDRASSRIIILLEKLREQLEL